MSHFSAQLSISGSYFKFLMVQLKGKKQGIVYDFNPAQQTHAHSTLKDFTYDTIFRYSHFSPFIDNQVKNILNQMYFLQSDVFNRK